MVKTKAGVARISQWRGFKGTYPWIFQEGVALGESRPVGLRAHKCGAEAEAKCYISVQLLTFFCRKFRI